MTWAVPRRRLGGLPGVVGRSDGLGLIFETKLASNIETLVVKTLRGFINRIFIAITRCPAIPYPPTYER